MELVANDKNSDHQKTLLEEPLESFLSQIPEGILTARSERGPSDPNGWDGWDGDPFASKTASKLSPSPKASWAKGEEVPKRRKCSKTSENGFLQCSEHKAFLQREAQAEVGECAGQTSWNRGEGPANHGGLPGNHGFDL